MMLLPGCPCCGEAGGSGCCACNKVMLERELRKVGNPNSFFKLGYFTLSYSLSANGAVVDSWDGVTGEHPGLTTSGYYAYSEFHTLLNSPTSNNYARLWCQIEKFWWERYGYLFLRWQIGTGQLPYQIVGRTKNQHARFHCGGSIEESYDGPVGPGGIKESQFEVLGGEQGLVTGLWGTRTLPSEPTYGILTLSTVSVNGMPPSPEETARYFKPSDGFTEINSVEFVSEFTEHLWDFPNATSWRLVLRADFFDPRIVNLSPCYTDPSHDADPPSGSAIGLCRKPMWSPKGYTGKPWDPCVISRECECAENDPEGHGGEEYDVFLPDGSLCDCCCYPNQTSIESIEGMLTVDNPTHTFGQNSPYAGLPAKVFVTDPTDSNFGQGATRVVIVPAEYVIPFARYNATKDANNRGSWSNWEHTPQQCGTAYAWAQVHTNSCREDYPVSQDLGQHLFYDSYTTLSVPVYRSADLGASGGSVQSEIAAGLNAACDSSGWDWNFWVDTTERSQSVIVSGGYEVVWTTEAHPNPDEPTSYANYPRWSLDIVTDNGAETLSGKLTKVTSYNESTCKILRTETFGTGEGFSIPIVSDDCWNPLP